MDSWSFLVAGLSCPTLGFLEFKRHVWQQWLSVLHECWPVLSHIGILFSSWAWSQLLNTSKATSKKWGTGIFRPNCNFWSFHLIPRVDWLIMCSPSRDWPSEVEGSILVCFLSAFTNHPWIFFFFLGYSFNLFTFSSLLKHIGSCASWLLFPPYCYSSNRVHDLGLHPHL